MQLQKTAWDVWLYLHWDREVNTADPNYFKWTQKVFGCIILILMKTQSANLLQTWNQNWKWTIEYPLWMTKEQFWILKISIYYYKPINRCPKTWLKRRFKFRLNRGRCSSKVEQKPMRQRVVRNYKYAERLLDWLESLPEWTDSAKEQQRNWIWKRMNTIQNGGNTTPSQVKNRGWGDYIKYTRLIDTVFGWVLLLWRQNIN